MGIEGERRRKRRKDGKVGIGEGVEEGLREEEVEERLREEEVEEEEEEEEEKEEEEGDKGRRRRRRRRRGTREGEGGGGLGTRLNSDSLRGGCSVSVSSWGYFGRGRRGCRGGRGMWIGCRGRRLRREGGSV